MIDLSITKLEEVWTADNHKLGQSVHLYHRLTEINPLLELYASYLEVCDLEVGDNYFVPTDYIGRDSKDGRLNLTVTLKDVMERTWTRMPDFVMSQAGRREELA